MARSRRKLCRKLAPLSLAALLAACGQQNTFVAPPPPKVMVAKPVKGPKVQYVEATGNTAALANVDLEARVQGFLEKISYKDGHPVKQGDLLFEIQRDTYEAQLAQAQANFESAQAAVVNADIQYQRQLTLGRQGTTRKSKLTTRRPRSIKPRLPWIAQRRALSLQRSISATRA